MESPAKVPRRSAYDRASCWNHMTFGTCGSVGVEGCTTPGLCSNHTRPCLAYPLLTHSLSSLAPHSSLAGFAAELLSRGAKAPLQLDDLDAVAERDAPATQVDRLTAAWEDVQREAAEGGKDRYGRPLEPSLWLALYRCNRHEFWMSGLHALLESAFRVAQPVFLSFLLAWMQLAHAHAHPGANATAATNATANAIAAATSASATALNSTASSAANRTLLLLPAAAPFSPELGLLWAILLSLCGLGQAIVHHQLYMYTMRAGWNIRTGKGGLHWLV